MPIPTDTFWNVRKLNWVFAASGAMLVVVIVWSIIQDWDKSWREPQRQSRAWEAALVEEKIQRMISPAEKAKLADLSNLVESLEASLRKGEVDFPAAAARVAALQEKHASAQALTAKETENLEALQAALLSPQRQASMKTLPGVNREIQVLQGEIETLVFKVNNLKAQIGEQETALQDARASADESRAREIEAKLERPRAQAFEWQTSLDELKRRMQQRVSLRRETLAELDELRKVVGRLGGDVELLRKKLESLDPDRIEGRAERLLAKGSQKARGAPLAQWLNPSEKPRQLPLPDVQTDVSFMKIPTIDRCTTCHVHIDRPDFAEGSILNYLEEQLATSRQVQFIPSTAERAPKAGDPTELAPGAAGMPEFWHAWAMTLNPELVAQKAQRIAKIAALVAPNKGVTVTHGGKVVDKFEFKPGAGAPADEAEARRQNEIVAALLQAWYRYAPPAGDQAQKTTVGAVTVTIAPTVSPSDADAAREEAFAYPMELRSGLQSTLDADAWELLLERYRYALVEKVNVFRKERDYQPLDASPVLLAHPKLELYASMDSPHNMELVGCTSCHDGSGQETDFVLAAHTPRPIWVDEKTGVPVLLQQIDLKKKTGGEYHGPDLSDMLQVAMRDQASLHFTHLADKPGGDAHAAEHGDATAAPGAGPVGYVDPVSGERRRAISQAGYWAAKHERESGTTFKDVSHYWDWPMRPKEFIEANCARCHVNIHDIREEAPRLYEGRALFAQFGCVNCHQMDSIPSAEASRKVGPDLRHVHEKLSPEFIQSWVWAPKAFRPSTMMPHFFMLENNSSDEELRRTQQEVLAITTYLMKTATPSGPSAVLERAENKMPAAAEDAAKLEESVARGRSIFLGLDKENEPITERQGGIGCIACHTNLNEVGAKWITADLVKGGRLNELIPKLTEELTKEKKRAPRPAELNTKLQAAARERYNAMSYNERQLYAAENFTEPVGMRQLPKYPDGTPKPIFQHHGPELSGTGTKLLAGGRGRDEARQWLYSWLMDPKHYSEQTVMPRLRLSAEQAMDLAEYLLAQERATRSPDDAWQAVAIQPDPDKITKLVSHFLRGQYDAQTAAAKASDERELTRLAALSLRSKSTDRAKADQAAAAMTMGEKQLVFLGQKMINHYGCMQCHAINGMESASSPGANLSDWGQKAVDKLDYGFLTHHKVEEFNARPESATTEVPLVNALSIDAVTTLTKKLNEQNAGAASRTPTRPGMVGGAAPTYERLSQDVTVAWPHVDHTRTAWLEQKLKNSRVYDRGKNLLEPVRETRADGSPVLREVKDESGNVIRRVPQLKENERGKPYEKLRMPTFYLNDEQVRSIVTFVISNRYTIGPAGPDRLISSRLLEQVNGEQPRTIALGRQIAEKFNCMGCHQLDQNIPAIQQYWQRNSGYFTESDAPAMAPPSLRSEGSRVQHAWLFNFLKHVEQEGTGPDGKLRPQPFVRMPSFPLTDQEATALAAYFAAIAKKESKLLARELEGLMREAAQASEGRLQAGMAFPDAPWPKDDWYLDPKHARLAGFLKEWALANTLARPVDFAPGSDTMAKSYKLALLDARFMSKVLDSKYPFTEQSRPTISDERFKKGEELFQLLTCHTCHVVGDERNPGVNQAPKAPNLVLAPRRLQREWVRHWIQEPQTIQPGNPMASIFFSGRGIPAITDPERSIYSLHGLPHLTGTPTPELAKQIQLKYGATVEEQAQLVMDFVFAASLRGHTSIDPLPGAQPQLPDLPANYAPAPIPGITAPLPEKKAAPRLIEPPKREPAPVAAPALPKGPAITGRVIFSGKAPAPKPITAIAVCHDPAKPLVEETLLVGKTSGLKNVIVYVNSDVPAGAPVPPPALLDQQGCRYEPHVLAVMVGQEIMVRNSDPFMHNVNMQAKLNPAANFSQNNKGDLRKVGPMKSGETFKTKCDVHPWMNAHIAVLSNPFFAVTDEDGNFTINDLPPGNYTITTWHEVDKLEPVEQQVTVNAGAPAQVTLTLEMPK